MHSYRDIIEGFYQIYKTWDWEGIFWIDEKQLFATWAEISSVVVNVLLQCRYQSQHFNEWAILKKYAIFSNNSKIKSMRYIANSFFHNYLLCLKQISQEMKCMYIKWISIIKKRYMIYDGMGFPREIHQVFIWCQVKLSEP